MAQWLNGSMAQWLNGSMASCLHVSMCLHSPCLHLHVSEIQQTETKLTVNGIFSLFAANGKGKWQTSVCLLKTETENRNLFALVGNRKQ
jgi:hypothetical protein